jgi:nitroreductase/Pyruvate/2-oxoacid:ferredoxin oxidoreductase delta subunit
MRKIVIDESKCSGCMLCAHACPLGNFEPTEDGKVRPADKIACLECGHCVAVCPMDAVTHAALDMTEFEPVDEDAKPDCEKFLKFLKLRRSRREFKDEPVPREVIEKLLRAAVHAPSTLNKQSVEYTIIADRAVIEELSDQTLGFLIHMKSMMQGPLGKLVFRSSARAIHDELSRLLPLVECFMGADKDMVLFDAPCVILLHAPKTDFYAQSDATFNAGNILLAAETLGLGACVVGLVTEPMNRSKAIKALARIPEDHRVLVTIALGYPKFKYKRTVPKKPAKVTYV